MNTFIFYKNLHLLDYEKKRILTAFLLFLVIDSYSQEFTLIDSTKSITLLPDGLRGNRPNSIGFSNTALGRNDLTKKHYEFK